MNRHFKRLSRRRLSIGWKLILPFVLITLLMLFVLLPAITNLISARIEAEADRQLTAVADAVGALITDSEKQVSLSATLITRLPILQTENSANLKTALLDSKNELGIHEISFYSADFQPGDPAAVYGGPPIIRRLQASEQTIAIRDALIQQALQTSQPSRAVAIAPQSSQIIGVAPVFTNGQLHGAILSAIYMDDAYINNVSHILAADIGIVRDNAVIISSIDANSDYKSLIAQGFISPNGTAAQTIFYGDGTPYRLLAQPLLVDAQPQGTVLVAQPLSELYQLQNDIQRLLLMFALAAALISILWLIVMMTAFAWPMQQLSLAAKALSAGNLKQRVNIPVPFMRDELSDLGDSFNEMSEELQALYAGLEYRVEKRTNELEEERNKLNHALQELAVARDQAVAANQAKSEFVSLVSHELKVPMTSIRGYNQLLSKEMVGPLTEQQKDFVRRIENNVDRMAMLVSDLTDVSRLETGHLKLTPTAVALHQIVDDVLHATQTHIQHKNQQLTVDISPDLPAVWADRSRLAQILTNLISNANKYTPEAGQILISAQLMSAQTSSGALAKDYLLVTVKDSGIGIHKDDLPQIFQKFFRSEDDKARQATGTGLGLNITKSLVELQGGSIWFESEFRVGTTFYFTLPLAEPRP